MDSWLKERKELDEMLANIKVGDQVVVVQSHGTWLEMPLTVKRLTKTKIILKCPHDDKDWNTEYRRTNGDAFGGYGGYYSNGLIRPYNKKEFDKYWAEKKKELAITNISNKLSQQDGFRWKNLKLETLRTIYRLIETDLGIVLFPKNKPKTEGEQDEHATN